MSDNNTNEAFWRVQYRLLLTALYQESNRFWTRFQVGLAVNGGLLAFFYALLHFGQCCEVELKYSLDMWILIIISGLGIFLSGIWYELTRNGFDWQGYWINKGKKLEAAHKEDLGVEIFRGLYSYEGLFPVGKLAKRIPILFLVAWALFLALIIGFHYEILTEIIEDAAYYFTRL